MKFWLGLTACLLLAAVGATLTMEGAPPDGAPVPAAPRPPASPATGEVTEADRAGVPRQMQARVILARQASDPARQASDPARQLGDAVRPAAMPAAPGPEARILEARRQAEARVRQAETEAAESRKRLEQEEARASTLSDAATAARRELTAARAEAEELRARVAQGAEAVQARAAVAAAEEARRVAEEAAEDRRHALAEERARAEHLAAALAEARRRVADLETAAEAARTAHRAQEDAAARERAAMRAGLRRLAVALRAAEVARSEAASREGRLAGERDRAEQGRQAAERERAETRGRLDRLKGRLDQVTEARQPDPSLVFHSRLSAAPRAGSLPVRAGPGTIAAGSPETVDEERLLARVAVLLGRGDISGARLFLTLGVRGGSARATALLAETYDPDKLAALQVRGMRGDRERASALYRQAQVGRKQGDQAQADRDRESRDLGDAAPARGPVAWSDPVRQAGLPGPFVMPLAAPWPGQ